MDTPRSVEDLEALWKDKEPATHGNATPPLTLACQYGDSIRRMAQLDAVEGVDYGLIRSEEKRADAIRYAIDANREAVCLAIQTYWRTMFHKQLEPNNEIYGNLPYFCRKISKFISGENPPW